MAAGIELDIGHRLIGIVLSEGVSRKVVLHHTSVPLPAISTSFSFPP